MKLLFIVLILVFSHSAVKSQTLAEWFRVNTFDDNSIVELNTNYVMFSTNYSGRVRFRWTYSKSQSLNQDSKNLYRTILQEIAFDCGNKRFSRYETKWFDAEGKLLKTENPKKSEEWQAVDTAGITGKLYYQACKLIELRKREPALEQ